VADGVFLIPAISVYTIVLGTLSILSTFVDRKGHRAHWCARAWSWLILATTGVDVAVTGLDRVTPGETYMFVSNHQSIYDIPVLFASLPFQLRIIAKESLGRFPFLGWHLVRAGHLLVDRSNPDRAGILNRWRRLVADRVSLIIFPEGTRSADGHVDRFKGGSFLLALEAGLTIVPLSVSGTIHVMKKNRLMTCPGQVTLEGTADSDAEDRGAHHGRRAPACGSSRRNRPGRGAPDNGASADSIST
jgi:1-acyl-sn-glycerol-3-phosphate acyltransferase